MSVSETDKMKQYETESQVVTTTEGDAVTLTVPTHLPDTDRCEHLRRVYESKVTHPDGHWKGQAVAVCSRKDLDDVVDAMDFHGSLVDNIVELEGGLLRVVSAGYWAHGF